MTVYHDDVQELVAAIPDGASVAVPPDYSGVAMAATRALVARGVRNLHLIAVPQSGFQADLLIGAGAVSVVEAAGINLGEHGLAPRFTDAVQSGQLRVRDATCPAIHAGLQAAEKGIPFIPLRGILGSDLLRVRPDWKVIENPYGVNDPICLIPAIKPDFALFHAPYADRKGNVWIGTRRELMLMAHAARQTLVTVETVRDDDLLADPALAAGTIPSLYITRYCRVARGSWPLGLFATPCTTDGAELARYTELAATPAGFARYLAGCLERAA
jgi:glutaconate CoA-transferase subunit A